MNMAGANKARDELEKILNSPEYQIYSKQSKGLIQTWWDKAKEWLSAQLEKLFPALESADGTSEVILIAVIVMVVILLLLSAYFLIRNMKRNQVLRKKKPLQTLKERNWTFQRHLEEAKKLELAEDYSGSTRHLFLALLLSFHERGWLEARIWKTNWEYYDELRNVNKQCAVEFYDFASFFDEVTYGETIVQRVDYLQFQSGVMKWLEEADPLLERNGGIVRT
jgi:hypothetical protein